MRLLTIHNLAYLQRLMAELRDAIDAGRLAEAAAAVRAGAAPWELALDPFKAFEAEGWSARAGTYDALMARATAFAIEPLLDAAQVGPGVRVLDVGCGPGALSAAAAARGARVTGVDLAEGMLARRAAGTRAIEFVHADAEELPFADGAFDVALGAFIVNHLPAPRARRGRAGTRRAARRAGHVGPAGRGRDPRPARPRGGGPRPRRAAGPGRAALRRRRRARRR